MSLSDKENGAILELGQLLRKRFGDRIKTILLYGSKARGDSDVHSDTDLFILVDREDKVIRDYLLEAAYETNLKYDVVLSVVICGQEKFDNPLYKITPFINNVLKYGIKIES